MKFTILPAQLSDCADFASVYDTCFDEATIIGYFMNDVDASIRLPYLSRYFERQFKSGELQGARYVKAVEEDSGYVGLTILPLDFSQVIRIKEEIVKKTREMSGGHPSLGCFVLILFCSLLFSFFLSHVPRMQRLAPSFPPGSDHRRSTTVGFAKWQHPHSLSAEQSTEKEAAVERAEKPPAGTKTELRAEFFRMLSKTHKKHVAESKDYGPYKPCFLFSHMIALPSIILDSDLCSTSC